MSRHYMELLTFMKKTLTRHPVINLVMKIRLCMIVEKRLLPLLTQYVMDRCLIQLQQQNALRYSNQSLTA